jgi:phage shock protein A
MQQHLNNRWLNTELIVSRAQRPLHVALDERPDPYAAATRDRVLRSTAKSHRRMWQHLATSALLLGSLAFSYIAWSQTSQGLAGLRPATQGKVESRHTTQTQNPAPTQAASDNRDAVHALRRQNHELHERIAQLKTRLEQTTLQP